MDKDFGELVFLHGQPHCGLIRLVDIPSRLQGKTILEATQSFEAELSRGAIITVGEGKARVRLPMNPLLGEDPTN